MWQLQEICKITKTLSRASLKALGLSDGATQVEIREAYLQLTKVSLFDRNCNNDYVSNLCRIFKFRSEHVFALRSLPSSITGFNHQESHPDVNKDPKASEEFHRVKIAYDRLRRIYEEDEKQSQEHCEEGRKDRGNTFKSGVNINDFRCILLYESLAIFCTLCTQFSELNTPQGFKSWSKDDWMNKVAEEGRKRQQYRNEENKYSS